MDAKQCGDSWHFLRAVSRWADKNGITSDVWGQIKEDIRALLVAPTGDLFVHLVDKFRIKYKSTQSAFYTYFEAEWVKGNKWMAWAMSGRNVGADTGDQKGEAYNLFLQQVVFGGVKKCPLHVVLHKLHDELQQVHTMLNSPKLLEARIAVYEAAQRRHDPNRLKRGADALADLQASGTIPIAPSGLVSAPPASSEVLSAAATDITVSTLAPPAAAAISPLADLYQHFDPDFLDEMLGPAWGTASPTAPSADAEAPSSPLAQLYRSDACVKCNAHAAKACELRCCKRCCVAQIGPCSISAHEAEKLGGHPIYINYRERITAALSSEGHITLYISYKSKQDRIGLGCRPIIPLRWVEHTEETAPALSEGRVVKKKPRKSTPRVMLVATCIADPATPIEKHFYLLRMLRVELQPF